MGTLLILNAKIVNENTILESDIYIRGGRIEKIGSDLSSMKVRKTLDIKGKYLLPGMIDANVHFRQTVLNENSGCNESQAAVAGGVTTYFGMADSVPHVFDEDLLEKKMKLASEHSLANYSFYLGASNNNLEDIKALDPQSCCGLNLFMSGVRDSLLVDEPQVLESIFKESPVIISAHCEDTPTIFENEESYRQIYGDSIPFEFHSKIRSEASCIKATNTAVKLATAHKAKLHIQNISTANQAELFNDNALSEKLITAEVSSQYLVFTDDDYEQYGALIKSDPAIKTQVDRAGLFQGLMDARLDTIATAHLPLSLEDKEGNYFTALSGLPTIEYALPTLLEHYQDGIFSLEFIVEKTSHAVANIFDIKERGYIREGYWADFVVIDIEKGMTASNERVISKAKWTPFDGYEFRSRVHATIVNGDLVYANKQVRTGTQGRRVEFNREKNA